jgi:hypothetical protein
MPAQAVHLFVGEKVRQDQLIGLHDGDRRDQEHVSRGAGEGFVGCGSLDGGSRVTQRGTVLRGLLDEMRRGVPAPL